MLEKLLENWLDNASERSYQAVFVQMLAADGYKVLHSTRHCTLEYGKDVLAVAADGVGCVFQLKGDPGRKMNVNGFREIQTQLVQMLTQRPSYPGFPAGPYRAYLVSNGQFNEEVQIAAHELNNSSYPARLDLWSRGDLLSLCKRHGLNLWPSEIKDNRALLEIYMANSRDPVPLKTLDELLSSILSLREEDKKLKADELRRATSSAAWATGICLAGFSEAKNYYAVALGWTLCWALIRAAESKHAASKSKHILAAAEQSMYAVLDALSELWDEVEDREHLTEGNPMTDADIYGWRVSTLIGLLSTLAFADAERNILSAEKRMALRSWLMNTEERPSVWGEGAIGQLLPWICFLYVTGASERASLVLLQVTEAVVTRNQSENPEALATPHYTYEEIHRDAVGLREGTTASLADRETFASASFTADALFRFLVVFGLKEEAQKLWPQFNRLGHRYFEPDQPWHYWLFTVRSGIEATRYFPLTYEWVALEREVDRASSDDSVVGPLGRDLWLLFMWWQTAPHRLNSDTASIAGRRVLELAPAPMVRKDNATTSDDVPAEKKDVL